MGLKRIDELDPLDVVDDHDLVVVYSNGHTYKAEVGEIQAVAAATGVTSVDGATGDVVLGTAAHADVNDFDPSGAAVAVAAALAAEASTRATADATLIPLTEKGASNGVATLNVSGTLTSSQLPDLSGTYQPLDPDLTALAALSTTSYGLGFLSQANAGAVRSYIGLVLGTDVLAYTANLAALDVASTTFGRSLLNAADAPALRTLAALGSLATVTPTGTADGTKFLRDDGSWQVVAAGGLTSGTVDGVTALGLVTPTTALTDGLLIKGGSATWGDTGVTAGGGDPNYGKEQVLAYHRYDAVSTDPNDVLLFRLDKLAGMGLAGGIHNAYGLRQDPTGPFTPFAADWKQLFANGHGEIITNPSTADVPTWNKSWLICQDIRSGSTVNVFQVDYTAVLSQHPGGFWVSGGAGNFLGSTSGASLFVGPPSDSDIGVLVRAHSATHSSPLLEAQKSDTTVVWSVGPTGLMTSAAGVTAGSNVTAKSTLSTQVYIGDTFGLAGVGFGPSVDTLVYRNAAGEVKVANTLIVTGKTGSNATPIMVAGGTASGAPSTGAHVKGEVIYDDTGRSYYCTVAGTPGTWVQINSSSYQPLAANLTAWAGKTAPSGVAVGTTDAQTLTNKTLTSPAITTPTGIVKGDVGLGNVDNTSDATKNAASVTLTNKTLTAPVIATIVNTGTLTLPTSTDTLVGRATTDTLTNKTLTSPAITTPTGIVKGDVGLGNVDNTSDATKNSASVTLTNKTLTAPVIATIVNTGTLTLPTSTDTLVGRATTDTLTNKTLTSPAITTPTGIVKGDVGLGNVDNTSDATKNSATATLTNKRVTPRVTSITSSATPTVNTDNADAVNITALAVAVTSMTTNLSGTPTELQMLRYRIKDDGSARALSWGASFVARGATPPTTTVAGKVTNVGFWWNAAASVWDCVSVSVEA